MEPASGEEAVQHRWVTRMGELAGVSEPSSDIHGQAERAKTMGVSVALSMTMSQISRAT